MMYLDLQKETKVPAIFCGRRKSMSFISEWPYCLKVNCKLQMTLADGNTLKLNCLLPKVQLVTL